MTKQKIVARAIVEMLGAPKEHIEETLKMYINKIKEESDIKVVKEHYAEAEKREDNLFSIFVELELETTDIAHIIWFCFDYMPASMEILEPEEISYKQRDFTDFLNDLQGRLHKYDMLIKNLSAENKVLKRNSLTLGKNTFLVALHDGPKDIAALTDLTGVPEKSAKKFLNELIKLKKVKEENNVYEKI